MRPMTPRTLCQICPLVPPSKDGVGDSAKKYHDTLLARGVDAIIVTSSDQRGAENIFPVITRWNAAAIGPVVNVLKRRAIDTVLFHYPSPRFGRIVSIVLLPLLLRAAGIRTTVYVHEYANYSTLGKLRIILMTIFAHGIIASDTPNAIGLRTALPWKRVDLLAAGATVVLSESEAPADGPDARTGKKNIFFFGFIRYGKGFERLLEAFETDASLNERCTLHLVGGMGDPPSAADRHMAARIKQQPSIVAHGFVEGAELFRLLRTADLFVLPYADGVSERRSSFMAAAMIGKPALTTKPSYPLPGLRDGENVLFLEDGSVQGIVAGIQKYFLLPDQTRTAIGRNAASWFDENFSDDVTIQKLIDILFSGQ